MQTAALVMGSQVNNVQLSVVREAMGFKASVCSQQSSVIKGYSVPLKRAKHKVI